MTLFVSAEEAVSVVKSGQRVFVHGACAKPETLVNALTARWQELAGVQIVHLHTMGDAPYTRPEMEGHFRHVALFIGGNVRQAVNEGRADLVPIFLSDIPGLFRSSRMKIDVAMLNLSVPDSHGFCSFGTSVDCALAAAQTAEIVIAQINPAMPRTLGDSFLHLRDVDYAVEVEQQPYSVPQAPISEVERRIGQHIASMVEDGSTVQTGIGAIPNAVLEELKGHRNLGVHTEMFSDGVVDLVELGVINGAEKTVNRGKIVTSFLMGTGKLYQFADDNPNVEMRPIDYTNDTSLIRRLRKMVAINSAIEIDLTGQVCADSIGFQFYSGVGGQMDFMRGAALSEGGKPIIALPSTARDDTISRIVGCLKPGAGVVTTRAHVWYLVTEYGIADIHGLTVSERVKAIINIAHPKFREELTKFARECHYMPG